MPIHHLRLYLLFCFASAVVFAQAGPPGGTINDLRQIDGQVYAASNSGVFRSADGGVSWARMSDGLPAGFPVLTVSGTEAQLFAAVDFAGVWRSRNGGAWEQTTDGIDDLRVISVAVNPENPDILLAGTDINGVFFSDNGGEGWIRAGVGLLGGPHVSLAYAPNDGQRVLATNGFEGVFESVDGGQVWESQVSSSNVTFNRIRFDPSNPDVVYVTTTLGLIRRTDPDGPFALVDGLGTLIVPDIAVDPADSDKLYASTVQAGMLFSENGGANWAQIPTGLPRAFVLTLAAVPGETPRVLGGLNGTGVFATVDQGLSWRLSSQGLHGAEALALAVDPQDPSNVYASIEGGGLFRSDDGGANWQEARSGLNTTRASSLVLDPVNPDVLYTASVNPNNPNDGSIHLSEDRGQSWAAIAIDRPFFDLAHDPSDGNTLWAGSYGFDQFIGDLDPLIRIRERGASFFTTSGDNFELFQHNIIAVEVDPNDSNSIWVVGVVFGVYDLFHSSNGGGDWSLHLRDAVPFFTITIDPSDSRRIFLSSFRGVIRSTDGESFALANDGFPPEVAVVGSSVTVDAAGGAVYASTTSGVFKSINGGDTWQAANVGLEDLAVSQVVADPTRANILYAATTTAGVYRTLDGGASWLASGAPIVFSEEGVVNGADFSRGAVSPGMIVSIFGVNLGPIDGVQAALDTATGKLPTTLAEVQVFFDDQPAPLFFVRQDQINCQVPFEVSGSARTRIRIVFSNRESAEVEVTVTPFRPGIFEAALNQDSSANSESRPAKAGEVVQLFITGQGVYEPPLMTGQIGPGAEPLPRVPAGAEVTVEIGGLTAAVLYVGAAPGFVGLTQLNARISLGVGPGKHTLRVWIGNELAAEDYEVWVE